MDVPEICLRTRKDCPHPVCWNISSSPVKREAVNFESLPSYDEFFNDIFLKNQLCILGSYCTESWASRKLWVDNLGSPNLEFLKQNYGRVNAPVTNCNVGESNCNPKMEMAVSDFLDYWRKYQTADHPSHDQCLYLKDWHFTRDFPSFCAYSPPSLLCSDWLNEFWDTRLDEAKGDDYRFVYLGPKNTWTPFHSDVLRSYSWSANICGRKKWIFFPPGDEEKLKDRYGQLVSDLRDLSLKDSVKYPKAGEVVDKAIVVIQNPGDIVFVPSGWHHQVFNLEDTISINHNWVNGASAHLTWAFLKSQLSKVKAEIADCSDMDGFDTQCQKILKADSGMDYVEFYNFIATIAKHRMWGLEAFCLHREKQGRNDNNVQTKSIATNPVEASTESLCLWTAAMYNSESLCAKTVCKRPNYKNITFSNGNETLPLGSGSSLTPEISKGKDDESEYSHEHCPHWSHCGAHLAVFDLQRTRDIISEVITQPEWKSVLSERETVECPVLEGDMEMLIASIEETLARAVKCLSL